MQESFFRESGRQHHLRHPDDHRRRQDRIRQLRRQELAAVRQVRDQLLVPTGARGLYYKTLRISFFIFLVL